MSRFIHRLGILLLAMCGGCSRTTQEKISLGVATLVIERTSKPGFLDAYIRRNPSLVWRDGRREPLPTGIELENLRLEIQADSVWLVAQRSLLMRSSPPRATYGNWFSWAAVPPSDALFEYMDEAAKRAGNVGVFRSTYTIPKRMGENVVHGLETETLPILSYEAKSPEGSGYSIAPTSHRGASLPYRIQKVDFASRIIFCELLQDIPAMPKILVFSPDTGRAGRWHFDRSRSANQNGF